MEVVQPPPLLAAGLSVSTGGHLLKFMRTFSLPVSEAQNLHKKEKPLRGNVLSFCFNSFI